MLFALLLSILENKNEINEKLHFSQTKKDILKIAKSGNLTVAELYATSAAYDRVQQVHPRHVF